MSNAIFAFLDNVGYKLDGVEGFFKHEIREVRYPSPRTVETLTHRPSKAGKKSAAYEAVRNVLGDDYVSDLTDCIERYVSIAIDLGYVEPLN